MLAVIVSDSPGVLARVAGLFARRGYNINSLAVGATNRPGLSRMTITFEADDALAEQIEKQLYKLIDVCKVIPLSEGGAVSRELALIRVNCEPSRRTQVAQLAHLFRARVVDVSPSAMVVEVSGTEEKVMALIRLLADFGLQEIVRTGPIALDRGLTRLSRRRSAAYPGTGPSSHGTALRAVAAATGATSSEEELDEDG